MGKVWAWNPTSLNLGSTPAWACSITLFKAVQESCITVCKFLHMQIFLQGVSKQRVPKIARKWPNCVQDCKIHASLGDDLQDYLVFLQQGL